MEERLEILSLEPSKRLLQNDILETVIEISRHQFRDAVDVIVEKTSTDERESIVIATASGLLHILDAPPQVRRHFWEAALYAQRTYLSGAPTLRELAARKKIELDPTRGQILVPPFVPENLAKEVLHVSDATIRPLSLLGRVMAGLLDPDTLCDDEKLRALRRGLDGDERYLADAFTTLAQAVSVGYFMQHPEVVRLMDKIGAQMTDDGTREPN